jgi:hypothetical protein
MELGLQLEILIRNNILACVFQVYVLAQIGGSIVGSVVMLREA